MLVAPKICPGCGLPFFRYDQARTCSKACIAGINNHAGRARAKGLPSERIGIRVIAERDKWVCQLCLKPIDKTLTGTKSLSPALDHIIPLSRPGSPGHVLSNVQIAHFGCNSAKRDR